MPSLRWILLTMSVHGFLGVAAFGVLTRQHHGSTSRIATIATSRRVDVDLFATKKRRGAMDRQKDGFGKSKQPTPQQQPSSTVSSSSSSTSSGTIYSRPALYDLAFGYRNYEAEVEFLLKAHHDHSNIGDGLPLRILELAAGPARHGITALGLPDSPVQSVTAVDLSPEMVQYGMQMAKDELGDDILPSFHYVCGDMRSWQDDTNTSTAESFDSAWILLGSLQHMTTNANVLACFQSTCRALVPGGTLVLELPHPRETFSMVECTRNGWEVPLNDDQGKEYGELQIVWGDDDDPFDPIQQVRNLTVSMTLQLTAGADVAAGNDEFNKGQSVREVVSIRLFTAQEIDALARCSGLAVVAMYGALAEDVSINDEDEAFRLVCVLRKTA